MKQTAVLLVVGIALAMVIAEAAAVSPVGPDPCPEGVCECTKENKPVCATDGSIERIFENDCLRKCEMCKTRIFWTAYESLAPCSKLASNAELPTLGGVKPLY